MSEALGVSRGGDEDKSHSETQGQHTESLPPSLEALPDRRGGLTVVEK